LCIFLLHSRLPTRWAGGEGTRATRDGLAIQQLGNTCGRWRAGGLPHPTGPCPRKTGDRPAWNLVTSAAPRGDRPDARLTEEHPPGRQQQPRSSANPVPTCRQAPFIDDPPGPWLRLADRHRLSRQVAGRTGVAGPMSCNHRSPAGASEGAHWLSSPRARRRSSAPRPRAPTPCTLGPAEHPSNNTRCTT